jgi:hypothetical protein
MAKTGNYSMLQCDRCGKKEYLPTTGQYPNRWYDARRVMANDTDKNLFLCANCYAQYQDLMTDQDADFNTYMKNIEEAA